MDPMKSVPNGVRIAVNQIPVRLDILDGDSGRAMWRGVRDFEHATLCRPFGLDPIRFWFDLPSSCRGIGSNSTGNRHGRIIDGYVMLAGQERPWGKLTVLDGASKIRDFDPTDRTEWEKLGQ